MSRTIGAVFPAGQRTVSAFRSMSNRSLAKRAAGGDGLLGLALVHDPGPVQPVVELACAVGVVTVNARPVRGLTSDAGRVGVGGGGVPAGQVVSRVGPGTGVVAAFGRARAAVGVAHAGLDSRVGGVSTGQVVSRIGRGAGGVVAFGAARGVTGVGLGCAVGSFGVLAEQVADQLLGGGGVAGIAAPTTVAVMISESGSTPI